MTFMEWLNRFTDAMVLSGTRPAGALQTAYEAGESPEDTAEIALRFLSDSEKGLDPDEDGVEDEDDDDDEDDEDARYRSVWSDDD